MHQVALNFAASLASYARSCDCVLCPQPCAGMTYHSRHCHYVCGGEAIQPSNSTILLDMSDVVAACLPI